MFSCLPLVLRLEIAKKKSYIETIHKNVKKLKEEIDVKQRNLMHNKENAKRYDNQVKHKYDYTR